MRGKAFKFGDNISTDHIAPGRLFHLRSDLQEFAKHVLEDADETFASRMQKGDFVVAGNNFGLGSSREHAPQIIKIAGVGAVIAKSFARIFIVTQSISDFWLLNVTPTVLMRVMNSIWILKKEF